MITKYNRLSFVYGVPGLVLQVASFGIYEAVAHQSPPDQNRVLLCAAGMLTGTILLWVGIGYSLKAKGRSLYWTPLALFSLFGLIVLACLKDRATAEVGSSKPVRNWAARLSLYLGILSIVPILGCATSIAAIGFSFLGLQIARLDPQRGGRGQAIAGMSFALVSIPLWIILFALGTSLENREYQMRDMRARMQKTRHDAWQAVWQSSDRSEELIRIAQNANHELAQRIGGEDGAKVQAIGIWSSAVQRAGLKLAIAIRDLEQSDHPDITTLTTAEAIQGERELYTRVRDAATEMGSLLGDRGVELITLELQTRVSQPRAAELARVAMNDPQIRLQQELRAQSALIMQANIDMLTVLERRIGHWELDEEWNVVFDQTVPETEIERYPDAMARIIAAAEEETRLTQLLTKTQ